MLWLAMQTGCAGLWLDVAFCRRRLWLAVQTGCAGLWLDGVFCRWRLWLAMQTGCAGLWTTGPRCHCRGISTRSMRWMPPLLPLTHSANTSASKLNSMLSLCVCNRCCCEWFIIAFLLQDIKKVKVAHTRLSSVWFRSWSWILAFSLQVTWVINPAIGCRYFQPGLQLHRQPLRGLPAISLLGERGTMCVNSLPRTVTRGRQPDSIMAAIWTQALLRLSPAH